MANTDSKMQDGLKRLLKICPDITLDPRQIQLLIDGKRNRVISEYKGTYTKSNTVEVNITQDTTEKDSLEFTIDTDNSKSFNEYFTKQED